MSNSPAFPSPQPSPLLTALGLGLAIVGGIVVTLAFKFMCKAIRAGTEPLDHTAASAAQHRRRPPQEHRDDDSEQLRDASLDRPPLPGLPPSLPAFAYNRPLQKKVADAGLTNTDRACITQHGEEAAACSVCLGAIEFGEMVWLLPVCLHLYHAECIDPWLRKHSTCPVCRSETNPAMVMDVSQLPPV
uniref:RING-type E3 ubiquitin transferase n=1 Tax=Setaria viridis TaxID=4556 RepID=A0A4U6UYH1_SETVI|nr:hypothetical protein SEVIR_4G140900v2 [Setaria viridis]